MKFCHLRFAAVIGLGFTSLSLSLASVPSGNQVTDDTALYQRLSEIRVNHEPAPNFDGDINRLSQLEGHYKEKLPHLAQNSQLSGAIRRISAKKYRYSGK